MTKDPLSWIDDELQALDRSHLRRWLRSHVGPQGPTLRRPEGSLISFASNDYLGLAADARACEAARREIERSGWGSGASPLVVGHSAAHERLEARLAEFEDTEAALVFTSGFAANVGTIVALVGRGDAVFSDEWNHASLVDGCRLSRAEVRVYPHGDVARLELLLREARKFRRRLIVSDGLFSMDGDLAPLAELAELAERYDCMLLVDEAHATGVFGERGRGAAEALGVERRTHVRVGTLSKALGGVGGFVCGSRPLIEWLLNRARPYVFSTALPAAACAAAEMALAIVRHEPQRRQKLLARAAELRERLASQGWRVGASAGQIVPLVVGEASRALLLADALAERGVWVPAIRPPTVPDGASRLRVSLSYAHDEAMLQQLVEALDQVRRLAGPGGQPGP